MPDVPYKVEKPWGHELVWARSDRYVGKILHVKAGHILSLQYHNFKDETMHVLSGELILRTKEGDEIRSRLICSRATPTNASGAMNVAGALIASRTRRT